jgi:small subunit ribosomal protein S1
MSKEVIKSSQFAKAMVVKDDFAQLSAEQMQELQSLYDGVAARLKTGELLQGVVVSVDSNGVLVDIDYKSNGLISRYEFSESELKELKPGAPIEVILDQLEDLAGAVTLSYEKAKALKAWDRIIALHNEGKPIQGLVTHTVKGGLSVDIGIPAFLPGSQVDIQRVTDFEHFVGQTVTMEILKINKKRGNVIVSRRKYLSDQRAEQRREAMQTLAEGQIIQGQVKNITNYGVFIDIGGIDGLLHITDMTWGRIAHPSEMVKIGDTITVKVITIDKDNSKISLGMKQLSDNPWSNIEATVQEGKVIKGRVSSITDYGMFIEVKDGVEGLIHISEISWTERISDLNKYYKVGDEVEAKVVSVDKDNRRMSLSIKQLSGNPWETIKEKFKEGDQITGKVTNITDFGVFIQLMPGIDGLAHISDLSWTEHIEHPRNLYTVGEMVKAVILSIDETAKKISLGVKQLVEDPWTKVEGEFPVGTIFTGKAVKIANFGTFIKLPNGIEALVPTTEKGAEGKTIENTLEVGKEYQFRIVSINREERKINLSSQLEAVEVKAAPKRVAPKKATEPKAAAAPRREAASTMKSALQLELERLQKESKGE